MSAISKSLKIRISISTLWLMIGALVICVVADDSYSDFNITKFLFLLIALNLPLIIYWLGFWIWGEGYILNLCKTNFGRINHSIQNGLLDEKPWSEAVVHPWRRYFARMLDISIYAAIFTCLILSIPSVYTYMMNMEMIIVNLIIFFFSTCCSAIVMGATGSSVGKLLFGIKVRNQDYNKLSFKDACGRELRIWISGQGFGIPLISSITALFAYFQLKKNGMTLWDKTGEHRVIYANNSIKQISMNIAGVALLFAVIAFLNLWVNLKTQEYTNTNPVNTNTTIIADNSVDQKTPPSEFEKFLAGEDRLNTVPQKLPADDTSACPEEIQEYTFGSVPKFKGRLDETLVRDCFSNFISENDGKIVYIDAFIPKEIAYGDDNISFRYDCEYEYGCAGDEYLIRAPEESDTMYQYISRLEEYHIKGYWTIMANTALNQGIWSNVLSGIAIEDIYSSQDNIGNE